MKLTRVLFFGCVLLLAAGAWSRAAAALGQMWARHQPSFSYQEQLDHTVALVADQAGNVITAGTSTDTASISACYTVTKRNEWGRILWRSRLLYEPYLPFIPSDSPPQTPYLALAGNGDLYLAETERYEDFQTHWIRMVKYNGSDGSIVWNHTYTLSNGSTDAYVGGIVFDSVYHNLFMCATTYWLYHGHSDTSSYDWGIARIDPDNGSVVWDTVYQQVPALNATDQATGICLDSLRDPVVCGFCYSTSTTPPKNKWAWIALNRADGTRKYARSWARASQNEENEVPMAITSNSSGMYMAGAIYSPGESKYRYALVKLNFLGTMATFKDTDNTLASVFGDNWLNSVTSTVAGNGRVYGAGVVDNLTTFSDDWLVTADSTGVLQTTPPGHLWTSLVSSAGSNDDAATAVTLDNQNNPWALGFLDNDTTYDWGLRRFDRATGAPSAVLSYHRNNAWDELSVPTSFSVRDTNHIYATGFTIDTIPYGENHTLVRFSARVASAALDSLRDSTFAWRDTVDSGAVVWPRVAYHTNGYCLSQPTFTLNIGTFHADSLVDTVYSRSMTDTVGAPPDSARLLPFPGSAWRANRRGNWPLRCTMDLAGDTSPYNNRIQGAVFVRVRDVGPDLVALPDTVEEGSLTPVVWVRNYGNANATFPVTFQLGDSVRTATVTDLLGGYPRMVTFAPITLARGSYRLRTFTSYADDVYRANDTLEWGESLFVRSRDVACRGIIAPAGNYNQNDPVTPTAALKNLGNVTSGFWTHFLINPLGGRAALRAPQSAPALPAVPAPQSASAGPRSALSLLDSPVPAPVPRSALGVPHSSSSARHSAGAPRSQIAAQPPQDLPYHDSAYITLAPGESLAATFAVWTAVPGSYLADCYTTLAGDADLSNDTAYSNFSVGGHDVGVRAILAPLGSQDTSAAITPSARVNNFQNTYASFPVRFTISDGSDAIAYTRDTTVNLLAPGDSVTVVFPVWMKPHAPGSYTEKCSTMLLADAQPDNDAATDAFTLTATGSPGIAGWTRMSDILVTVKNKRVKDGAALAYEPGSLTDYVYALKGNNTYEFYRYSVATNSWETRDTIPAAGRSGKKKAVKKGSGLTFAGDGKFYATKGNNTYEFWQYDPARPTGLHWVEMANEVPPSNRACREGLGMASVTLAGTNYVYLLKGSGTYEFYRYNADAGTWATMASAPGGIFGKPFKNGSSITYNGGDSIYCLKGTYNEFFAYSISHGNWMTLETLPRRAPGATRKTKVKAGSGTAFADRAVYALKGANTNEFWMYRCDSLHWTHGLDMPTIYKKVNGGGALVAAPAGHTLFAFRGNNTLEFWRYATGDFDLLAGNEVPKDAQGQSAPGSQQFALSIAPNPFAATVLPAISYSLPRAGDVRLELYDVTGKLVMTLARGYTRAGRHVARLDANRLARGIYLLKYENEGNATTGKLIVE